MNTFIIQFSSSFLKDYAMSKGIFLGSKIVSETPFSAVIKTQLALDDFRNFGGVYSAERVAK